MSKSFTRFGNSEFGILEILSAFKSLFWIFYKQPAIAFLSWVEFKIWKLRQWWHISKILMTYFQKLRVFPNSEFPKVVNEVDIYLICVSIFDPILVSFLSDIFKIKILFDYCLNHLLGIWKFWISEFWKYVIIVSAFKS